MDIKDFTKQQGEFLKADVVVKNPEALFEVIGEATIEYNKKFNTDRLHIPVKSGDSEYIFDASKTNARTIKDKLGEDTKEWIGKHLVLETYKTKTSEGKMTDALNVKEVK